VFVYRALLHKAGQYAGRPSEVVQVRASAEIEYALWWGVPGLPSARMPPARPGNVMFCASPSPSFGAEKLCPRRPTHNASRTRPNSAGMVRMAHEALSLAQKVAGRFVAAPIRLLGISWLHLTSTGFDLHGNTFWEFKDQLHALRNRRIAKYSRSTQYSDVNISRSCLPPR
jgi:hypothetical protein